MRNKLLSRKELKRQARQSLKKHYLMFVMVCLIAAFLGTEFSGSFGFINFYSEEENHNTWYRTITTSKGIMDVADALIEGREEDAALLSKKINQEIVYQSEAKNHVLARSRGVLAEAINSLTTGAFLVTLVSGLNSIFNSYNLAIAVIVLLCLIAVLFFWLFIIKTYSVIARRLFLEGRLYEHLDLRRFFFLIRTKQWINVTIILLRTYIYQFLWMLTIVGGIIKRYSYYMVPYIAAENPSISSKEAILLSRKMMYGHKWECFLLELSLIGWIILDIVTMGLSAVLFTNAYQTAIFCEYYVELRRVAKEAEIEGSALLNNRYLYEKAEDDVLKNAYSDVINELTQIEDREYEHGRVSRFFSDTFGVVLRKNENELKYEENQLKKKHLEIFNCALNKEAYPTYLSNLYEGERNDKHDAIVYTNHYSLCSMILLFFIFSAAGWIWEVALHMIMDGELVNRGALHGPWLPIYGGAGILILTLLYKLRKKPVAEFFSIIVLCGVVEYFTSIILETMHDGQKWWDYSGYYLNIDGRVCAEGLLIFGILGVAFVYFLAPLIDEWLMKIKLRNLTIICIALIIAFSVDCVYSVNHPNGGKGVNDYKSLYEQYHGIQDESKTTPAKTPTAHPSLCKSNINDIMLAAEELKHESSGDVTDYGQGAAETTDYRTEDNKEVKNTKGNFGLKADSIHIRFQTAALKLCSQAMANTLFTSSENNEVLADDSSIKNNGISVDTTYLKIVQSFKPGTDFVRVAAEGIQYGISYFVSETELYQKCMDCIEVKIDAFRKKIDAIRTNFVDLVSKLYNTKLSNDNT